MYFTSGSDRAFEQLMQTRPGADHFDSGEAGAPEDCGTCRFYRPHWKYQFCVYEECPYQPGKLTALDGAVKFQVKGVDDEMAVFRVEKNRGYTVMSNHHLRNKDLSLKAKGLLSHSQGSFSLDCVKRINDFFKFLPFDLDAVAVQNHPASGWVFLGKPTQFVFSNAKIFRRFLNGKRILFPNRHIVITHNMASFCSKQRFLVNVGKTRTAGGPAPRAFHPRVVLTRPYPLPVTLLTLGLWL